MMGGRRLIPMVISVPSLFYDVQSSELMLQKQQKSDDKN